MDANKLAAYRRAESAERNAQLRAEEIERDAKKRAAEIERGAQRLYKDAIRRISAAALQTKKTADTIDRALQNMILEFGQTNDQTP